MNQSVQEEGIFLLSECLFRIVPDVLGAVGEPHSVMPVARTAAAATAVAVTVEVVVAAVMVTPAATADPEGRLLGLVAPPEIGRDMVSAVAFCSNCFTYLYYA